MPTSPEERIVCQTTEERDNKITSGVGSIGEIGSQVKEERDIRTNKKMGVSSNLDKGKKGGNGYVAVKEIKLIKNETSKRTIVERKEEKKLEKKEDSKKYQRN